MGAVQTLGRGRAQVRGSAGVFMDWVSRCREGGEEGRRVECGHRTHPETECLPSGFPLFPEASDPESGKSFLG